MVVDYIPWICSPATGNVYRWRNPSITFDYLRAEVANEIKQSRRRLGLSQEALALQAEVDRTYVSQLERGVANPSLLILYRISVVLGMDLAISFKGTND